MAKAPKILTADEAEKLKQETKDHHNHDGKPCKNHFEEHHDKIIIIEKPKEEVPMVKR